MKAMNIKENVSVKITLTSGLEYWDTPVELKDGYSVFKKNGKIENQYIKQLFFYNHATGKKFAVRPNSMKFKLERKAEKNEAKEPLSVEGVYKVLEMAKSSKLSNEGIRLLKFTQARLRDKCSQIAMKLASHPNGKATKRERDRVWDCLQKLDDFLDYAKYN